MNTQQYFEMIGDEIKKNYSIAEIARSKGFDPKNKVEVPLALTMAAKVVRLISTIYPQLDNEELINRLLDLEKKYGALEMSVSFAIAEEIAKQKFCAFKNQLQAIDAGIRVGFAYMTLGVVASPIEGYTELKIGKTRNGKEYFIPYFSGPIRSAGTTASCVVLMLIDYLRQVFSYEKYDPNDDEVKRMATEIFDYHERVTNLQYCPTEEEVLFLAKNLPIQIAGDPTERFEVSNYKDLERVDTNFIRGGLALIFAEGLAQKAKKGLRLLKKVKSNGFQMKDWEFLEEYVTLHEKRDSGTKDTVATYIKDIVAGRPIFGHPSRSGGFRFRYGRSRVSGFSGASVHPATMGITDNFIATGTQLKIEKPTKGCVVTPCDSIEGPIVKLKNGSVKKIKTLREAQDIYEKVEEILYLGDILFPFGDVANRNSDLLKSGYVEEWWKLDLIEKGFKPEKDFDELEIKFSDAVDLSLNYSIPLHPNLIFYWTQISEKQFLGLIDWLQHGSCFNGKIILPYSRIDSERFADGKRALEIIGAEHEVTIENVVVSGIAGKSLLINLGFDSDFEGIPEFKFDFTNFLAKNEGMSEGDFILDVVNKLSKFKIKDKAGDFIGSRMGRPEKAKIRKLIGSPNVLFPIGSEGGRLRSLQESISVGYSNADFPTYYCDSCKHYSGYKYCLNCKSPTTKRFYCWLCKEDKSTETCEVHGKILSPFKKQKIDVKEYLKKSVEHLGMEWSEIPKLIKGIRGTSSGEHIVENLAKGVVRAKYGLQVNKDGTIRYDMTELPITHFKPYEVGVSIEKLKQLGYEEDIFGEKLEIESQILELRPHDIILPCNSEAGDERADEVFVKTANFIDELLVKFYKLEPFHKIKSREDLIGQLTVCMAPHNCAGVISRIIGFSTVQGLLASPYMHAAMRRDCDGDEAAVMLLSDVLINFSREYLPAHRGGTQDAPLVLNGCINAKEVDDQILDFDVAWSYPLELYLAAEKRKHSSEVKIEMVKQRLSSGKDTFSDIGFTHNTSDFNKGVNCSSYKLIPTMQEKVDKQMALVKKIRSVDTGDVARLILERHFIRDMRGNLRKFSQQQFRCVKCNEKFRRPPLEGKCTKCSGKIIFTISEGGIVKYLEPSLKLVREYDVPAYVRQTIELTKKYIESIFGKETEKQTGLNEFLK